MSADRYAWEVRLPYPEALGIRALGFLAADRVRWKRFLSRSGLPPAALERHPVDPEHLVAILDFLIADEAALLAFARAVDLPPETVYEARRLFGHVMAEANKGFASFDETADAP